MQRGITWADLTRHVGVATSTIRRFASAADAEADGVLALVRWLEVAPEDFVTNSLIVGSTLPAVGDGIVRAAQRSGRTVASVTHMSEA